MTDTVDWKKEFETFRDMLSESLLSDNRVKSVRGKFSSFCPYLNYIRVDFLEECNWPHNIAANSIFIDFSINLKDKVVEAHMWGHTYLTDADSKATYLAMASMKTYCEAYSALVEKTPWFRKTKIKTYEDAVVKISKFVSNQLKVMEWATGGYPYKKAVRNIYNH